MKDKVKCKLSLIEDELNSSDLKPLKESTFDNTFNPECLTKHILLYSKKPISDIKDLIDAFLSEQEIKELEEFVVFIKRAINESEKKKPEQKPKEVDVKPYYFEKESYPREFVVTEICDITGQDKNIGSHSCRMCKNCISSGDGFIKCKLKPEGKPKQEPKRFKRDEFGVISEVEKDEEPCEYCVYVEYDSSSKVCKLCDKNNKDTEYYSSK